MRGFRWFRSGLICCCTSSYFHSRNLSSFGGHLPTFKLGRMVCNEGPRSDHIQQYIVRCLTLEAWVWTLARRGSFAVYEAYTLPKPDLVDGLIRTSGHRPQLLGLKSLYDEWRLVVLGTNCYLVHKHIPPRNNSIFHFPSSIFHLLRILLKRKTLGHQPKQAPEVAHQSKSLVGFAESFV